jgi:hypothetical protein
MFPNISVSPLSGVQVGLLIHPTVEMSDHTLPAITAAIRNHDPDHSASMIWIDAFCMPIEPLARRATLESMGFIYSRATQVIVVLSNKAFAVIEEMSQLDTAKISSSAADILDVLENDAWMRSVWTYQEVVNSQDLLFTGHGMFGKFIRGESFLNRFGHYLHTWKGANGYNFFDLRAKYPFLDAFEDVVLDWRMAGYQERSALQVMSQMDRRCTAEPCWTRSGISEKWNFRFWTELNRFLNVTSLMTSCSSLCTSCSLSVYPVQISVCPFHYILHPI